MDASVISAISGFAGVLITSVVSLIVTKVNSKKDVTIVDRQQLSQDQQAFYNIVMKQVTDLQERADILEEELREWKEQATQLGIENTVLKNKIIVLEEQVNEQRKD